MPNRMHVRLSALALAGALVLLGSSYSIARQRSTEGLADINIKNFGRVNADYYRGAQPDDGDYRKLAELGIKTVIDLERVGEASEENLVKAAGMKFVRLEMSDREAPTKQQVSEFLAIVDDPANLPVYVHCHGGKHRTGAMTAVYRMVHDGWTATQAFQEMKTYNFAHGFGHGALKDFVFDYYGQMKQKQTPLPAAYNAEKSTVK